MRDGFFEEPEGSGDPLYGLGLRDHLHNFFVVARLRIAVMNCSLSLRDFLNHKTCPTFGAGRTDGFVPKGELALRILVTSIEELAATRFPLHQFAFAVGLRTSYAQSFLSDVLALGVIPAGCELSITSVLDDQVLAAFRARLV